MFVTSILLAIASAQASAGDGFIIADAGSSGTRLDSPPTVSVVVTDASVASVEAVLSSDAGEESLSLVESDAWLHGVATLADLPREDAAISLTLYDARRASVASFSGRLGADGSVSLAPRGGTTGDCSSRLGCEEQALADVELRGAASFAGLDGQDFSVDLVGADAYSVVYATLTVSEPGEEQCLSYNRAGDCVSWASVDTSVELVFDEIGAVWEGSPELSHEGPMTLDLRTRDSRGRPRDSSSVNLASPWRDEGAGASALSLRGDDWTSVGLIDWRGTTALTLSSGGWTLGEELPVSAEVELTGGGTVTMARHSIQRRAHHQAPIVSDYLDQNPGINAQFGVIIDGGTLTINGGSVVLMGDSDLGIDGSGMRNRFTSGELDAPLCGDGVCVMLTRDNEGTLNLAVTRYGWDESFIAGETNARLTLYDPRGTALATDALDLVAGDELDLVFAAEVEFVGDPLGGALTGSVNLLDAADGRGRQATLASGDFYGVVTRDADGELSLAGVDNDDVAARPQTSFAILLGGYSPDCGNEDDGFGVPPPLAAVAGNGSGTRAAASATNIKPRLL